MFPSTSDKCRIFIEKNQRSGAILNPALNRRKCRLCRVSIEENGLSRYHPRIHEGNAMALLQLWFTPTNQKPAGQKQLPDQKQLELLRTSFFHPLLGDEAKTCVRGKTAGPYQGCGTFNWTQGVLALCVVLLRAAASSEDVYPDGVLEGQDGSLACSLDYALCKMPVWLLDMFGVDSKGRALAPRLFQRLNSCRKRPGPVVVSLNSRFLDKAAIRIFVDGNELHSPEQIRELAEQLTAASVIKFQGADSPEPAKEIAPIPSSGRNDEFAREQIGNLMREIYFSEARESLLRADIFSRVAFDQRVKYLSAQLKRQNVSIPKNGFVNPTDAEILEKNPRPVISSRDFLRRQLDGPPLRVCSSPNHAGALAVFSYLQKQNIPLEFNHNFAHASALLEDLIRHDLAPEPDLCVLGFTQAATLLAHRPRLPYGTLMFLPSARVRVLALKNGEKSSLGRGQYGFLHGNPTSCSAYFAELMHQGAVRPRSVNVERLTPAEVFARFRERDTDLRAISWFPFCQLNEKLNGAEAIDDPSSPSSFGDIVLLAHERILRDPVKARALDFAVRDAWLSLIEQPESLKESVSGLLEHPDFCKVVYRTAGITELVAAGSELR